MTFIIGLLQGGNVLDSWIPVGAVLAGVVALLGATVTFFRFMRAQELAIDSLRNDLQAHRVGLTADLAALRSEMQHRFERLDDRNGEYVRHREFVSWVDRLRDANPAIKVPSMFDRE